MEDIKKHHKQWFYFNGHYDFKRLLKMAELHALWNMFITLGYTTYGYALFLTFFNVDSVTRLIVSITGALFLISRLIIGCVTAYRKHKEHMIDIRMKENELRQKEIRTYKEETDIIRGFDDLQ